MSTALVEVEKSELDINFEKLERDQGYRAQQWDEWNGSVLVGIIALSYIYCAMIDAGDPLSEISDERAWLYQMIGRGQILGELYWEHGSNQLFPRMCKYNKDDQRRLVSGGSLDILAVGDDGKFDWKKVDKDE